MVGQLVAHYRVLSEIGSGGMGSVYLARDEHTGNEVALKVLLREHAADPDMRSRFLHEARAQAMISHPNVAAFLEVGEDSGQVYIAMEYIPGPTLADYVSKNELRPTDAIALVTRLAHGLEAAHSKGVIHRDLKPGNIMLTADGQPKIMDFGLARFKGATTITKTGRIIGTARYMSPEQAEGRRVDHRSDLFSLGIILYELICRRAPFDGDNDTAVLYELLTKDPQPLSRYASHIPAELELVLANALAKEVDKRYQSAGEFVADLEKVKQRIESGDAIRIKTGLSSRARWRRVAFYAMLIMLAAGTALVGRYLVQHSLIDGRTRGLVVLPLRNIGDPNREYFTDGVTDEITTRLAAIDGLRVVSRTTAIRYKETDKPIPAVARELGVDLVLAGTVRWDSSATGVRLRIVPELILAENEQALWTGSYDRRLEDVLFTQSEIAEAVTQQIGEQLGQELKLPAQTLLTSSVDAYNYYLRGSEYLNRGFDSPDLDSAIVQFGYAITLDTNFAAAWARLSRTHSKYYWFHEEGDSARRALAQNAALVALRLSPQLPESHLAMGFSFYWGELDYDRAFDEFVMVRNLEPSNADAHAAIAAIFRRRGQFDKALESFAHASHLDPLSSSRVFEVGNTLYHMRRCAEADSCFDRTIALSPDGYAAHSRKILNYLNCAADTKGARHFIESSAARFRPRMFDAFLIEIDRLERKYDSALVRLAEKTRRNADYYAAAARIYGQSGRTDESRAHYDSARAALEVDLATDSTDPDLLSDLGIAYAGLGRADEAIELGQRAIARKPVSKDAFGGPYYVERLAQIYTLLHMPDSALSQLELLMTLNSPVTKNLLRLDPEWQSLWDHPRFARLGQ